MKILKNGQKYAIKFDRKCKNAKHRCHQQLYYKLSTGGGGLLSTSLLTISLKFLFISSPPQLFFSKNCIRNRLHRVSFIELFNFIIYQRLIKRPKILPLTTSQVAHLCNHFKHVCIANF